MKRPESNAETLAAMAEVAAITDPCERAAAGASVFGKRWIDVMTMWITEGGRIGGA